VLLLEDELLLDVLEELEELVLLEDVLEPVVEVLLDELDELEELELLLEEDELLDDELLEEELLLDEELVELELELLDEELLELPPLLPPLLPTHAGAVKLPSWLPWKPNTLLAVWPGAGNCQLCWFVNCHVVPGALSDGVRVTFHCPTGVMVSGKFSVIVQLDSAVVPVLVTLTSTWKKLPPVFDGVAVQLYDVPVPPELLDEDDVELVDELLVDPVDPVLVLEELDELLVDDEDELLLLEEELLDDEPPEEPVI
jgi:hypothetical protein